jgi:hypothetical protein
MNWDAILLDIVKGLAVALAGTITGYVIAGIRIAFKWIGSKFTDATLKRIVNNIEKTIEEAVEATEQTIVKTAKAINSWDEVKKGEAFKYAFDSVVATTNEKAKAMVTVAYGDLNVWLTNKIQTSVKNMTK